MRVVLMLAAVLIVSVLIFRGYAFGPGVNTDEAAAPSRVDPVTRAKDINPLIQETVEARRKAFERQLRQ